MEFRMLLKAQTLLSLTPLMSHSSQFFSTPNSCLSSLIYSLILVELSWWRGSFPSQWALLWYISNQMGPSAYRWYDSLRTCTRCRLILGKQISSRHYSMFTCVGGEGGGLTPSKCFSRLNWARLSMEINREHLVNGSPDR